MSKPRKYAHISLGVLLLGLFVYLIFPAWFWGSLALWGAAFVIGIVALVFNGRAFPNTEQMIGQDPHGLDLIGYIEVYVTMVPAISLVAILIFSYILRRGM